MILGFRCIHWREGAQGELNVCKWLYDNRAAEDITKADNNGFSPILGLGGHLSVCQWLFEVGAAGDIPRRMMKAALPCRLAKKVICRSASGCSRWAPPQSSPRRTILASVHARGLQCWPPVGVPVVVRGGAAGTSPRRMMKAALPCTRLARWSPVGVPVVV